MSESKTPEFEPPQACVQRVIKAVLPENVQIGKDAKAAFSRSAGIFIMYLTACANDFCKEAKRQTISAQDVMQAIKELEFGELEEPLREYLDQFRREASAKKQIKAMGGGSTGGSGGGSASAKKSGAGGGGGGDTEADAGDLDEAEVDGDNGVAGGGVDGGNADDSVGDNGAVARARDKDDGEGGAGKGRSEQKHNDAHKIGGSVEAAEEGADKANMDVLEETGAGESSLSSEAAAAPAPMDEDDAAEAGD